MDFRAFSAFQGLLGGVGYGEVIVGRSLLKRSSTHTVPWITHHDSDSGAWGRVSEPAVAVYTMEPSRIHAVEHVHLETRASLEDELIWFYGEVSGLDLISSWSEGGPDGIPQLRFRSANLELRLQPVEHPRVDGVARRLTLLVPSIAEVEEQLDERGIPFDRVTGLSGCENVVMVLDPTGHRVSFRQESRCL